MRADVIVVSLNHSFHFPALIFLPAFHAFCNLSDRWRTRCVCPWMVSAFAPGYVFLFFRRMMVLQLVWVKDSAAPGALPREAL